MIDSEFFVVVFLGVNGCGKTTFANELSNACNLDIPHINIDLLVKRPFTSVEDYMQLLSERLQIARTMMDDRLVNRQSFIAELTLTTTKDLNFLKYIKQSSATLITVFVLTRNIEINISRIINRVRNGGHDVPLQKLERRYPKFFSYMPFAIDESDICFVYDNSQWYRNILIKSEEKKINLMSAEMGKDDWLQDNLLKDLKKTNEVISVPSFSLKDNNGLFFKIYNCMNNVLESLTLEPDQKQSG